MEQLIIKMEKELERCKQLYEDNKDDAYLSFSSHTELEVTEELLEKLKRGKNPAELMKELEDGIPRLEELMRQEDEHPTFDEYSPHCHYFMYWGQLDAYKAVIEIIKDSI